MCRVDNRRQVGKTYFFDKCPQYAWHPEGGSINTADGQKPGFIPSSTLPTPSVCKIFHSINMCFLFDKSDKSKVKPTPERNLSRKEENRTSNSKCI